MTKEKLTMWRVVLEGRPPGFFVTERAAKSFAKANGGRVEPHVVGTPL